MAIVGLDVGSSATKCVVFSIDGAVLAEGLATYDIVRTGGRHCLDATLLFAKVQEAIGAAIRIYSAAYTEPVEAIGVTSFGEAFVMLDRASNPCDDIRLYTDAGGKDQCTALTERLSAEAIVHTAGVYPHTMYSISRMAHIREQQPEIFARAHKLLQIEDYVIHRLTGEFFTDYSLAARTMAFDIRQKRWWGAMLDAAGIPEHLLPTPVASGTVVGTLLPDIADSLGLPRDCRVVTGGHDQVCTALGAGVVENGQSVDGSGTVECITTVFDQPQTQLSLQRQGYCCVPYPVEGLYATYAFTFSGGGLLKWCRDTLFSGDLEAAEKRGENRFTYLESRLPSEPTGLLVLPHFAGAATPYMDDCALGAIIGLTLEHSRYALYAAAMEGIALEMRLNLERLAQCGLPVLTLTATGGGARSAFYNQRKADITGLPVQTLHNAEGGTTGCAMLAACALGYYSSLKEATAAFVHPATTYVPRPAYQAVFEEVYVRYQQAYDAIKPLR